MLSTPIRYFGDSQALPESELPTYADVEIAAKNLAGVAHRTPVMTSRRLNDQLDSKVYFKCENF